MLIKNLDDMHKEDLSEAKELKKEIRSLEAQIKSKNL